MFALRLMSTIPDPLMARLLHGIGMRLMECCRLWVKDIDFERSQIFVRDGKGGKDRTVSLPSMCIDGLRDQIERARVQVESDREQGLNGVAFPRSLDRKFPAAALILGWQFMFGSSRLCRDPQNPEGPLVRYHIHENSPQKALLQAVRESGISKRATSTRYVTVSRRICWKTDTTFAPCNFCSATLISRPLCLHARIAEKGLAGCGVRWM